MDSIRIRISFKSGHKVTKVCVLVLGVNTLFGVISQFEYLWSVLCKDERFPKDSGYVISIEDVDNMRIKPEWLVEAY